MFTLWRTAAEGVGMGLLPTPAWSSMVSVSPPSSMFSNPSIDPRPFPFLPDFELAPLGEVDGLAARLPPAPTLSARTIRSFIRMTGRKIGRRRGTKGDGYRMASEPSEGIGWYGSKGSGRDLVAMMMYCPVQLSAQKGSQLGESEGTHVGVYEREDDSICETVPPIAQEGSRHTCGGILSGGDGLGLECVPNAR